MDFKKKLKIRMYTAIGFIIVGIAMIASTFVVGGQNDFVSCFGFAFSVMGIARLRNYFIITKSEESIKNREIAETDERNVMLANKAKSIAFGVYCIVAGIAVIVLQLINKTELSSFIAYTICALVFIYWVSYMVIRNRN